MSTAPNGWQTPKQNWSVGNVPTASDFNRVEGNSSATELGNRTLDQALAAPANVGTLRQILSWFAGRLKAITGKTNWWDTPATTLAAASAHQSDYVLQVPYGVATGLADTYAVTLNPAPSAYVDGMAVAVKINVDNTGASTINVNSLGAKPIKKPNGNDVSAGNLKVGSIYSMRYNGTNFILQGSDAAGNAIPGDVLSGKTFSTDADTGLTGTMPDRGTVNITPSTVDQAIAAGKHSGSGVVSGSANLVAGNILKDVNIFDVIGNVPIPPVLTGHASNTQTPTAATTRSYTGTTQTKLKEIRVDYVGSIRAYWEHQKVAGSGFTNIALFHNGVEVAGTKETYSATGSWLTSLLGSNLNVAKGDLIQVYGWGSAASVESACRLLELRYTTTFVPHVVTLS